MITGNYFSDDTELMLMFERLVDWPAVVQACEGEDFADHKRYLETEDERYGLAPSSVDEAIELYRSTLDAMGEFWGKEVAPLSGDMDKAGLRFENGTVHFPPQLVELFEKYRDTGLIPFAISREGGGLGLPVVVQALATMVMARGDVSFYMSINLLNLAQIVARYGSEDQIKGYAQPAAAGETLFAMALTEPDYGSDLNNIRTTAEKQADGTYKLNGTKRYISQGCGLGPYPASMMALARTGKPGARGLSVFLVRGQDAQVAGIEHKMGIHSSPTCEIVFEDTPGELLGEEGQGLTKYTLGMTTLMRLGCAAGGAAGAAASYFESEKYARERVQFGKSIDQIPAVAEMLERLRRETTGLRLFSLETGFSVDMYQHQQVRMEKQGVPDREIRRNESNRHWHTLSALFTSLSKYYCSEKALELCSVAIQIHGGAGYTEDYDVSRFFRDARINTIYEGTSQLHIGISVSMISAGMSETGYLRRYFDERLAELPETSEFLQELRQTLEEAVPLYKELPGDGFREKYAEHLVLIGARYMCSLLFERAVHKLGADAPAHWAEDMAAYHLDSVAIAQGALYRIRNAGRVHAAGRSQAASVSS